MHRPPRVIRPRDRLHQADRLARDAALLVDGHEGRHAGLDVVRQAQAFDGGVDLLRLGGVADAAVLQAFHLGTGPQGPKRHGRGGDVALGGEGAVGARELHVGAGAVQEERAAAAGEEVGGAARGGIGAGLVQSEGDRAGKLGIEGLELRRDVVVGRDDGARAAAEARQALKQRVRGRAADAHHRDAAGGVELRRELQELRVVADGAVGDEEDRAHVAGIDGRGACGPQRRDRLRAAAGMNGLRPLDGGRHVLGRGRHERVTGGLELVIEGDHPEEVGRLQGTQGVRQRLLRRAEARAAHRARPVQHEDGLAGALERGRAVGRRVEHHQGAFAVGVGAHGGALGAGPEPDHHVARAGEGRRGLEDHGAVGALALVERDRGHDLRHAVGDAHLEPHGDRGVHEHRRREVRGIGRVDGVGRPAVAVMAGGGAGHVLRAQRRGQAVLEAAVLHAQALGQAQGDLDLGAGRHVGERDAVQVVADPLDDRGALAAGLGGLELLPGGGLRAAEAAHHAVAGLDLEADDRAGCRQRDGVQHVKRQVAGVRVVLGELGDGAVAGDAGAHRDGAQGQGELLRTAAFRGRGDAQQFPQRALGRAAFGRQRGRDHGHRCPPEGRRRAGAESTDAMAAARASGSSEVERATAGSMTSVTPFASVKARSSVGWVGVEEAEVGEEAEVAERDAPVHADEAALGESACRSPSARKSCASERRGRAFWICVSVWPSDWSRLAATRRSRCVSE